MVSLCGQLAGEDAPTVPVAVEYRGHSDARLKEVQATAQVTNASLTVGHNRVQWFLRVSGRCIFAARVCVCLCACPHMYTICCALYFCCLPCLL